MAFGRGKSPKPGEAWTVERLLQTSDEDLKRMVTHAYNVGIRRGNQHGLDETEGVLQLVHILDAARQVRSWQMDRKLRVLADQACSHMQERAQEYRRQYGALFLALVDDKRTPRIKDVTSLLPGRRLTTPAELKDLLRVAQSSLDEAKVERLKLRPEAAAKAELQAWLEEQQGKQKKKFDPDEWVRNFRANLAAKKDLVLDESTAPQVARESMEADWERHRDAIAAKWEKEGNAAKSEAAAAEAKHQELERQMARESDPRKRQALQRQADEAMGKKLRAEAITIKLDNAAKLRQTDLTTAV
ncbi:hypothetical protein [Ktedonospora formicarum]|uniref:Uncharacterized protein n=1 Tax=Ktedonospora formicarum TaxID=2778364 RepID=A0A8J3I6S6_9CHLR|nr:hypothetical protein [Ktedonospora formicarum]GHO48143.1 hypothetical protein KSX_63060 [Ktedonospora formicarum]